MRFNEKFRVKDLLFNKELAGVFPQLSNQDKLKNVYSFEWVENKIKDYIKSNFGGWVDGDDIIINGKYKIIFKSLERLKTVIEDLFNNIPRLVKGVRKNERLLTPFNSIDQIKHFDTPQKKIQALKVITDNLKYNPAFINNRDIVQSISFLRQQEKWLKSVGYKGR